MISRRTLSLIAAAAALVPAVAGANLVANGDMNNTLGAGFHNVGQGATVLTGWTFLNTDPSAEYFSQFGSQFSPAGGDYLGVQDLDSFLPRINVQGVTQTIGGLTPGAGYDLTFWSMSNHDGHGAFQDWVVSFGTETHTGLQTTPNADEFSGTWVQSTLHFTATSATQALTFVAQYLPGSVPQVLELDGVDLEVSPVPEPASWALLAAGLAGVAALARRRRKA